VRIYRASIRCSYADGGLVVPSLHYQTDVSLGGDEPDPSDVASGIWGVIGTAFRAATPSLVTIHDVVVSEQVIKPAIGATGIHTVELAGSTTLSSEFLPRGIVPIINLHTEVASRSGRGYMTLAGPGASGAISDKLFTGSYLTSYQTLAALLDNSFDLGTLSITHVNPVVYSRKRHVDGLDPHAFRVTSASVRSKIHYLRSRDTSP
jgi:hypothetical protein